MGFNSISHSTHPRRNEEVKLLTESWKEAIRERKAKRASCNPGAVSLSV
jgi:hypothetical protein